MMDVSEVQRIVSDNILRLVEAVGVPHWQIDIQYGPLGNDSWKAMCSRNSDYDQATITIDPAQHVNEDDVLNSVIHELIHVALAPLDLYRNFMTAHMAELGSVASDQERVLWSFTIEQLVRNIERGLAKGIRPETTPGEVTNTDFLGNTIGGSVEATDEVLPV